MMEINIPAFLDECMQAYRKGKNEVAMNLDWNN
jgi:hypothetical protein